MMRSLERSKGRESLESAISRIAFAYGFRGAPVAVSKKTVADSKADAKTATALATLKTVQASAGPLQLWGTAKTAAGTLVSFAVAGSRHAIGNALVVKTALSVAELSGFQNLSVLVSSVGDAESKKRFTRELTNFFKKHHDALPDDVKSNALHHPDATYRELVIRKDPLVERAPRSIDFLSENSRKLMMDTLSFFEAVGVNYAIDPRLQPEPNVHAELLFAIEASQADGSRVQIALGGRFDDGARKSYGIHVENPVAMSLLLPKKVVLDPVVAPPQAFVVHVGDAAKVHSFTLLEAMWRAHIAVTNALLGENLRAQIDLGKISGAKYLAIIGQREALDGTVIVRNLSTQLQTVMPIAKLEAYFSRGLR